MACHVTLPGVGRTGCWGGGTRAPTAFTQRPPGGSVRSLRQTFSDLIQLSCPKCPVRAHTAQLFPCYRCNLTPYGPATPTRPREERLFVCVLSLAICAAKPRTLLSLCVCVGGSLSIIFALSPPTPAPHRGCGGRVGPWDVPAPGPGPSAVNMIFFLTFSSGWRYSSLQLLC